MSLGRAFASWGLAFGLASGALAAPADTASERPLPPDPYRMLGLRSTRAPILDVTSICIPADDDQRKLLEEGLADWDPETALELLQDLRGPERALPPKDLRLLEWVLRARSAPDHDASVAQGLTRAIASGGSRDVLACGYLELARLRLHADMIPEVRTSAMRALRVYAAGDAPEPVRLAAVFYRAESLYGNGEVEQAAVLYEELQEGDARMASASQLRLADMAYTSTQSPEALTQLETLLAQLASEGASSSAWAPRAAEWAIARGDAEQASHWLGLAEAAPGSLELAALELRRADLSFRLGRQQEASELLRRISEETEHEAVRQLALARLVDWDHTIEGEALRQLARAGRSGHPNVAAYAQSLLAERLIARGDHHRALDLLVGLVHDGVEEWVVPQLNASFDTLLAGLTATLDCDDLMAAIAGRAALLLRHTSQPDPFLQLGDCYLELGMGGAALETYRSVTKTFGPSAVTKVTLRSAKAEFQVGRTAQARAAAAASISREAEAESDWRLLYARILLEDGRPEEAVRALLPVVMQLDDGKSETAAGIEALELAASAAHRYESPAQLRQQLGRALSAGQKHPAAAALLAESALLIADLHRQGGESRQARSLYRSASAALPAGPLRSRAIYWLGVLTRNPTASREIWRGIADSEDEWALLAANEIELADRRPSVGRSREVPSTRQQLVMGDSQ